MIVDTLIGRLHLKFSHLPLGEGKATLENPSSLAFDYKEIHAQLLQSLYAVLPKVVNKASNILCKYIATVTTNLILYDGDNNSSSNSTSSNSNSGVSSSSIGTDNWREKIAVTLHSDWKNCTVPYLTAIILSKQDDVNDVQDGDLVNIEENLEEKGSDSIVTHYGHQQAVSGLDQEFNQLAIQDNIEKLAMKYRIVALNGVKDMQDVVDEESANLCNIEFSLAFGGKILLHNTFLRLVVVGKSSDSSILDSDSNLNTQISLLDVAYIDTIYLCTIIISSVVS